MNVRMEFTPMEHATLLGLVGLAVSVMQHNEEQGRQFVATLTQPGIEATAKALIEKLNAPEDDTA